MKSKKAINMTFETLVAAIIVLVVLFVTLALYNKYIGKGTGAIDDQIDKLDDSNDCDGDGVIDIFDPCPCEPGMNQCEIKAADCQERMKNKKC